MKALSIRQPWAEMILRHGKDIENRTWPPNFRGRLLVHASKGMSKVEYHTALMWAAERGLIKAHEFPKMEELQRGGIVGMVNVVGFAQQSPSQWFQGPYGWVLCKPIALPFFECRGRLGLFSVDNYHLSSYIDTEQVSSP